MKAFNKLLAIKYLVTVSTTLLMMSCGGSSPQPSAQDQAKALLTAGTWKVQSEMVDGVDQTSLYTGFTINFTSTGYTTTKGGGIWPASGTWTFQGTSASSITRNDGVIVQLQLTSSSLTMTISWPSSTLGSGKTESTQGSNVFTMTK